MCIKIIIMIKNLLLSIYFYTYNYNFINHVLLVIVLQIINMPCFILLYLNWSYSFLTQISINYTFINITIIVIIQNCIINYKSELCLNFLCNIFYKILFCFFVIILIYTSLVNENQINALINQIRGVLHNYSY